MSMSASNIDFSIDCLCIRMQWKIGKFAGLSARVAGLELFIFLVKVERAELARTCSAPSLVMRSFWAKRKLKIEKFMITGEEERKTEAARKSLRTSPVLIYAAVFNDNECCQQFLWLFFDFHFSPFFSVRLRREGKLLLAIRRAPHTASLNMLFK